MRQLTAFVKKECVEVWRTRKLLILLVVFALFGIMNPAIAKLTPWMMEQFSDSFEGTGLMVTEVVVDAQTSWTQYYKNIPMALIVFLLMFSTIMAGEFQKGTLINMITKGLSRSKIVMAKTFVMIMLWTLSYWMCYGITYAYNEYFWDNSIAKHVVYAAFCIYMLGIWLLALMMLMSVLFTSPSAVAVGTGAVFFVSYMLSMIADIKDYLPTRLLDASGLLIGVGETGDYVYSLVAVTFLSMIQLVVAAVIFNKKNI